MNILYSGDLRVTQKNGHNEIILKKSIDFFYQEDFEKAILTLENNYSNHNSISYWQYKSIFLSFLLKQAWEQKKGLIKMMSLSRKSVAFNTDFIKKHPKVSGGYIGLAEHYQYTPSFLGGGFNKAEKEFQKVLELDYSDYDIYKMTLFFLNSKKDLKKARSLLELIANNNTKKDPFLNKYVRQWTLYQEGVLLFRLKKLKLSKEKFELFNRISPANDWGYFMLWKVSIEEDKENKENLAANVLLEIAKKNTLARGNLQFLDMISEEKKRK